MEEAWCEVRLLYIKCARCPKELVVSNNLGDWDEIVIAAKELGWSFDLPYSIETFCPNCKETTP